MLVDAPEGIADALTTHGLLQQTRTVVITSARASASGGLPMLLAALSAQPGPAIDIVHLVSDQRTPLWIQAWTQGCPDGRAISVDAVMPGMPMYIEDMTIQLVGMRLGELVAGAPRAVPGAALRAERQGDAVTWIPTCRPSTRITRLCQGSRVAVIEVGRVPWPSTDTPWRLSLQDAVVAAAGADDVWLIGDDRRRLDGGAVH